jgi:hypothetical protein
VHFKDIVFRPDYRDMSSEEVRTAVAAHLRGPASLRPYGCI